MRIFIAKAETVHISANFKLPNVNILEAPPGDWRTRGGHDFVQHPYTYGAPAYSCRKCGHAFADLGDPVLVPHCYRRSE